MIQLKILLVESVVRAAIFVAERISTLKGIYDAVSSRFAVFALRFIGLTELGHYNYMMNRMR